LSYKVPGHWQERLREEKKRAMDLVISRGSEVLMVFPVEQGTVRIGRAPGNDLILPLPSVSRR